jgi:hypothetical protein
MVHVLLDKTTLQAKIERALSKPFDTNLGAPQGDSLSPVLFVIYLELAMRQLRATTPRSREDLALPSEAIYADDTDFISTSNEVIAAVEPAAKCEMTELEPIIRNARRRMFGHTLRMDDNIPAKRAILHYFDKIDAGFQGRPRQTLPLLDLKRAASQPTQQLAPTSRCLRPRRDEKIIIIISLNANIHEYVLKKTITTLNIFVIFSFFEYKNKTELIAICACGPFFC